MHAQRVDEVARALPWRAYDDLVDVLAAEDVHTALVQVHDGIVLASVRVDRVVVVQAHVQERALRLGLLQRLDVAHMEQVEGAIDVHDSVGGLRCAVVGKLCDTPCSG